MTLPTFALQHKDGTTEQTEYHPLGINVSGVEHALALHRESPEGEWVVSDTVSGGRICRVLCTYKGVPVANSGLSLDLAKQQARIDVMQIAVRLGPETFNKRLETARSQA
jgi:hypothetical protein